VAVIDQAGEVLANRNVPNEPDGKGQQLDPDRPGKGFFAILRLYNPLQPFFDKTWRPSEIEPI
jgi:hypothetical protein